MRLGRDWRLSHASFSGDTALRPSFHRDDFLECVCVRARMFACESVGSPPPRPHPHAHRGRRAHTQKRTRWRRPGFINRAAGCGNVSTDVWRPPPLHYPQTLLLFCALALPIHLSDDSRRRHPRHADADLHDICSKFLCSQLFWLQTFSYFVLISEQSHEGMFYGEVKVHTVRVGVRLGEGL